MKKPVLQRLLLCYLCVVLSLVQDASARAPAISALSNLQPSAGGDLPLSMRPEYRTQASAPTPETHSTKTHKPVIVIDAGHGGMDPGTISKSGKTYEKNITLRYAIVLRNALINTGQYQVYLTRSRDNFVTLKGRVSKARAWKADLFISLHADSNPNSETKGLSVYTISEDRAHRVKENLSEQAAQTEVIRGVDTKDEHPEVRNTLLDLAQRANTNTSATFAEMLVKSLGHDAKLLEHSHRQKSLAVLTSIDVPSVLIELGYLSNREEENLLRTDDYRDTLVEGMKTAIDKYFRK